MSEPVYFHGGVHGLRRGEQILPPTQTGATSMSDLADAPADLRAGVAKVHRKDRVYLTTDLTQARLFAAFHPANGGRTYGGSVYQVEPVGDIEPDPDYLPGDGVSVSAQAARIVRIVDRKVPRAPYLEAL